MLALLPGSTRTRLARMISPVRSVDFLEVFVIERFLHSRAVFASWVIVQEDRIWCDSFASARPSAHAGSSRGLALVREVVEGEMRGQVRCVPSDLGGASFVLEVPSSAKETP